MAAPTAALPDRTRRGGRRSSTGGSMVRRIRSVDHSELTPDPRNANAGTARGRAMVETSLRRVGPGRSILLDKHGKVVAGNKTLEAAVELGIPVEVVETTGDTLVAVQRMDYDLDEPAGTAREAAYFDNRASEVGLEWAYDVIAADAAAGVAMEEFWFPDEITAVADEHAQRAADAMADKDERVDPGAGTRHLRKLPLDAYYTMSPTDASVFVAVSTGFGIGCRSTENGLKGDNVDRWRWRFKIDFIDNEYVAYDHGKHRDVVAEHRPKVATVRDIMTRDQCAAAGIPYYDFDQIMKWAEDLEAHVEEAVIVIPKFDCLSDIPRHYRLGYSVPTSYGGTPLPIGMFAGRPIHLLGGSWKRQRAMLEEMKDDVASIDFNHINHISSFGGFVYPDGSRESGRLVQELGLEVTNARQVCLAISLGHIARGINRLFGNDAPLPFAQDDIAPDVTAADIDLATGEAE